MPTTLNPYLSFAGRARQALEFYRGVFGGDLTIGTYSEMRGSENPADADLVMHGQLTTPAGLTLMASDAPAAKEHSEGSSISVSVSGDDEAELEGYFERLTEGGITVLPFERAPWGDLFGMCTDRFGINWMVNATAPAA